MGSRLATPASEMSVAPEIDALWLDTLHRICGRAAHELRGALNGVSVNLEVVRSRAAKPDTQVSAIAPFANAAVKQFDGVIEMTEALLFLARPAPAGRPVEIGVTARRIAALLVPTARADGRDVELDGSFEDLGATPAIGSAVRLAIGATMIAAIDSSTVVVCVAEPDAAGGPLIRITGRHDQGLAMPNAAVVTAAKEAGIEIQAERSAITITFPRSGAEGIAENA